jgi:prepilin-type processing-associated H-X9-DG protein
MSILSTLLLPALVKAKTTGKRSVCQSNMKQIVYASIMYSTDADDYLPAPYRTNTSWDDMLNGYDGRSLTSEQLRRGFINRSDAATSLIYRCPLDDPNRLGKRAVRSYASNRGTASNWRGARGPIQPGWHVQARDRVPYSMRTASATSPVESILFFDYTKNNRLGSNTGSCVRGFDVTRSLTTDDPSPHGITAAMNFAWADGHVSHSHINETMGARNLWASADCIDTSWDWKR